MILSLLATLFSYGAVNGESERGTLQLLMSNSVRRTGIMISKLIGLYIPLALMAIIFFAAAYVAFLRYDVR